MVFEASAPANPTQRYNRAMVIKMTDSERNLCFRVADANLNRAREAYRSMEEYARFGLADASLAKAIKQARHRLAASVPHGLADELIVNRDIVGDVGRDVRTHSEYSRADAHHVMTAACKRLTEALRVLEEYGKTLSDDWGQAVESLRYDAYELERRLVLIGQAQRRFNDVLLYVLLTETLCHGGWLETAQAVLEGGADCLQLREKHLPDKTLLDRAKKLAALCHDFGKYLIVNDRPDVAVLSGADGVHVGQDDLDVSALRKVVPANMMIGISTHTEEQAQLAIEQVPDYIAVGPMFASKTKSIGHIAGCDTLTAVQKLTAIPLVAIGGISVDRVDGVLSAVAAPCCVCVCSEVISDPDPRAMTQRLRTIIKAHGPEAGEVSQTGL